MTSTTNQSNPLITDLKALDHQSKRTVWLLGLMTIFLVSQQNLDSPLLSQIGRDLGLEKQTLDQMIGGLAYFIYLAVSSVSLIIFGYLADKINRKALLLFSIMISGTAYLMAPLAQTYQSPEMFIVLRSLAGVGVGGMVPVVFSVIGDIFSSKSRAAAAGIFMAVANVGYGTGFVLGSVLGSEDFLGWKGAFYVQSLILMIIGVFIFFMGKMPKRGQSEEALKKVIQKGNMEYRDRIQISDLKKIFTNKTNLILILSSLIATMPMGYIMRFMVDYYAYDANIGLAMATILFILIFSGAILGDVIGGYFYDKLNRKSRKIPYVFASLSALMGGVVLFIMFSFDIPPEASFLAILAPVLIGFSGAVIIECPVPISKAVMLNVNVPENRGTISALIQTTAQLGYGLGALIPVFAPWLMGILDAPYTRKSNFFIAVAIMLPVGLVWLLLMKTGPADEDRTKQILKDKAKAILE